MLGHSCVSNDNSNNQDFSKAYCRIKGILLLSLFSPPVDDILIRVGSKLHGKDSEGLSAPASLPGIDDK